MSTPTMIPVTSVVFRDDLYPRIEKSATTVQKYAEDLTVLPPIEVNQRKELIDGWHRWTAYKKNNEKEIPAKITETSSDGQLLELAIDRNASHGLQLSQEDKRNMARQIYNATAEKDRDAKKKSLAKTLSVSERTIRDWLSRIDKDSKEARDKRIFESWMSCETNAAIAEKEGLTEEAVRLITQESAALPKLGKPEQSAAEHATDFEIPLYNIWKQQTKTEGAKHFGNSEIRWLDNLLYLYTKPFDIVVDPFAGGGSTIDICRKRFRRYWVSDRKPVPERAHQIRLHDVVDGLPSMPRWKDVRLVYLDPPYWKQAEGKYSKDANDLANMPIEKFNETLVGVVNSFAKKLKGDEPSFISLIIQPTQWNSPDRQFVDHIGDMLRAVKLPVEMRYSVPYESQQCTAQMVEWAKKNRKTLVLSREIVVWKVTP